MSPPKNVYSYAQYSEFSFHSNYYSEHKDTFKQCKSDEWRIKNRITFESYKHRLHFLFTLFCLTFLIYKKTGSSSISSRWNSVKLLIVHCECSVHILAKMQNQIEIVLSMTVYSAFTHLQWMWKYKLKSLSEYLLMGTHCTHLLLHTNTSIPYKFFFFSFAGLPVFFILGELQHYWRKIKRLPSTILN